MTKETAQADTPPTGADGGVLPGLKAGGFVTTKGHPDNKATLAVLVAGPAPKASDGVDRANSAYLTLARELDTRGKAVVLGGPESSAGDRGVVNALRSNDELASSVSSVDTADTIYDQIAVVCTPAGRTNGQPRAIRHLRHHRRPLPSSHERVISCWRVRGHESIVVTGGNGLGLGVCPASPDLIPASCAALR
jgi:hypothetical protein